MQTSTSKAQKIFDKMFEKDYCSQWMGVELLMIEEGYCKIKMQVKQEMLNGYGILHGGIAFAFADSAFAFASNSYGRLAVSIQASMNYAKSAKEGDFLIAEAKALQVNHKTADFDVNVLSEATEEVMYYFQRNGIQIQQRDIRRNQLKIENLNFLMTDVLNIEQGTLIEDLRSRLKCVSSNILNR